VSSKRALRRKASKGKARYATEAEARQAIVRLRRGTGTTAWLTAYRCAFCGGFHFGHPPAKVRIALGAQR
jgi:hypothetical protein